MVATLNSCSKKGDGPGSGPVPDGITAPDLGDVTSVTIGRDYMIVRIKVKSNGGSPLTKMAVAIGPNNFSLSGTFVASGTDYFDIRVDGLTPATTYQFKGYASNKYKETYGPATLIKTNQ